MKKKLLRSFKLVTVLLLLASLKSYATFPLDNSINKGIINILTAPVAGFYATPLITSTYTDVFFNDTSLNMPTSWQWTITPNTFGFVNGTSATSQNPAVQFSSVGLYTVQLIVYNNDGVDSVTKNEYINIANLYCIPDTTTGATENDFIQGVRLANLNHWPIINDSLAYNDYSDSLNATLQLGETYSMLLWNTPTWQETMAAWIDFNSDGAFDVSEKLGEGVVLPDSNLLLVFTVPSTTASNVTRMRVRCAYNSTNLDPCLLYQFGQTNEYKITIGNCTTPLLVNLGNDTVTCGSNFTFNLDAGNPGCSYIWQNGYDGQTISTNVGGTYVVDVTDSTGCHGRDTIVLTTAPVLNPSASFTHASSNVTITFNNTSANALTYFWTFGDGATSTLKSPVHVYASTGQYTVLLTVNNACGMDTQQVTINVTNTGINNLVIANSEIVITPNPSFGLINVTFELLKNETISVDVFNVLGEKVNTINYGFMNGKQNFQMDLSYLEKGLYMLKFNAGNGSELRRIVIQ